MNKVCMISTTHLLKDSRIYYKEAVSLKKNGYDVICIYIGKKDISGVTEDGIKYIEVKACSKTYNVFDKIFEYKNYVYEKYSYETYIKIYNICKSLTCDIYHMHDLYLLQIVTKLKKLPFKPKVIYDVHESYPDIVLDYNKHKKNINKYLFYIYIYLWELIKASQCDYVINVEQNINKKFQRFIHKNRVGMLLNYPLINNFNSNITSFYEKKYDLIYCGSISKLRGVLDILRAVKVGKSYKNNLKVIFIGAINDNNLNNEILNYITENDLTENIYFTGSVPFLEVWDYYKQSKIGLVPLHNIKKYRWAVPIKMFEYMTSGLPIIGSNLPHIEEVVLNDKYKCGEIVSDIENDKKFFEAICKILNDKKLYDQYSSNCIEAIKKNYNWSVMEVKLLEIYNKLL